MTDLYAHVARYMKTHGLANAGSQILVGVSGGADSLCLLDCLHHLGFDLVVAHLDHMLRADSERDADYVGSVCDRYHVPFVMAKEDVRAQKRRGSSLEAAARQVRYRFLGEACRARGLDCVAVGHTQDDQVETVLMHFLRGTGLEGLSGMAPVSTLGPWLGQGLEGVRLIRPLLGVTREQTAQHCAHVGLEPRMDATNVDRRYLRNRVRNELIPLLETYNPAFRRSLIRLAEIMAGYREAAYALTEGARGRVILRVQGHNLRLDEEALLQVPPAVQRDLLRWSLRDMAPAGADLGFDSVERLLLWVRAGVGRRLQLPNSIVARLENGALVLEDASADTQMGRWPQLAERVEIGIAVPDEVALEGGWKLQLHEVPPGDPRTAMDAIRKDPLLAAFDASRIPGAVGLRTPTAGDRLRPYGLDASIKLSDLFTNLRVPRVARRRWPLLVSEGEILWVCGLRRSSCAPLTASTSRVIQVMLKPPPGEGFLLHKNHGRDSSDGNIVPDPPSRPCQN